MKPSSSVAIIGLQLLALALLAAGWAANYYKLVTYASYVESTNMTALRFIGVFIWPIGGVVGWF